MTEIVPTASADLKKKKYREREREKTYDQHFLLSAIGLTPKG